MEAHARLAAVLCLALALAGCGGGSATLRMRLSPAPRTAFTTTPLVAVASITDDGSAKTILTDIQGLTLYYFARDTATASDCTGVCASEWPPLLFAGSGTPTSATPLPGTLQVVVNANGPQVQYAGHFLYTFTGEDTPGDTEGDGQLGGQWHAVTVDLAYR